MTLDIFHLHKKRKIHNIKTSSFLELSTVFNQLYGSMCKRKLILIFLVLGLAFSSNGQDRTSENNERLKGWLKKFPEADKNKDGVLTGAEALEFIRSKKGGNPNRKKTAPKQRRFLEKMFRPVKR